MFSHIHMLPEIALDRLTGNSIAVNSTKNTPVEVLESTSDEIEEVDSDHMRDVQSEMMGDGDDEKNGDNDSDNRESSSDIDPQMSAHLPTPKNVRQQLTFVAKIIHPTHRAFAPNH
ncbi:hypothetical protein J3A83DRAFT_4188500 [Scleroderma citrinum]